MEEIDIIARDGRNLVFVEVKARRSGEYGRPEQAITPWKIRHMVKAAQYYKILHPDSPSAMRLDAVSITLNLENRAEEIKIFKNISQ